MAEIILQPQKGYQERVLASEADIVIGGAAAGVGKTYSLLFDFPRFRENPNWGGVIFRRTSPQIRNEGGLWDTSMGIYPYLGGTPKESTLEWVFKSGCKLKFSHLEYEKNIFDWQGAQIPFIGFDELTHFTEKMFFYLLSRNRSMCGIRPYVRATCNPDPESWVARLIEWWIDADTGYPISERDGLIRYFIKNGEDYIWGNTKAEVIEKAWFFLKELVETTGVPAVELIKSITFISGSIQDNKILLSANPGYLANLLSQDEQTQMQLLRGNWKVIVSENDIYDYSSFLGAFNNVVNVRNGKKYITADIALKGSNKFIILVWDGFEVIDIAVVDKSNGKDVITTIEYMARVHDVPNNRICYDNDGVGGFVDGFIVGAIPFNNGGAPAEMVGSPNGKRVKENYKNRKTQCYYRSGDRVLNGGYRISEYVANKMYDSRQTVRQRFMMERKAIKRDKVDADGKLCIISKEEMKVKLNGESPDLMDAFMQREEFELVPQFAVMVG